jgi:hypothetical protein
MGANGGFGASAGMGGAAGTGGAGECTSANDCPEATCRVSICDAGTCALGDAPRGSACDAGGGTFCDGNGSCVPWLPLSMIGAPAPRYDHSAVWTGSEMIVWGGNTMPGVVTNTGYRFDPATDSWSPISMVGAPSARTKHGAIWTGSEMVIWGGYGQTTYVSEGSRYNPISDTWTPTATLNEPFGRVDFSMIWDHNHGYVLIWGGYVFGGNPPLLNSVNLGSRYDVAKDEWTSMPLTGAPQARHKHLASWVPGQMPNTPNGVMVIFGGTNGFDWFKTGGMFDPVTMTWAPMNTTPGVNQGGQPPAKPLESAADTVLGSASLMVWGGWDGGNYYDDGYYFFPNQKPGGYWQKITPAGAPAARAEMVALVPAITGVFVWGGCGGQACTTVYDDGGIWLFGSNGGTWETVPSDPVLPARRYAGAVATATEVMIWGGRTGSTVFGSGARRRINP